MNEAGGRVTGPPIAGVLFIAAAAAVADTLRRADSPTFAVDCLQLQAPHGVGVAVYQTAKSAMVPPGPEWQRCLAKHCRAERVVAEGRFHVGLPLSAS